MVPFKYDIVTLIELVESKPCLWDKTNENHKNKMLRDESWEEIFTYLEDGYEQFSLAEKKKTGDLIMAKWSNIRDAFQRSLRKKRRRGSKKSYKFSEHLKFLLNIAQKDDSESNFSQAETEEVNIKIEDLTDSRLPTTSSQYQPISTSPTQSTSSTLRPKLKRQLTDEDHEILPELKKLNHSVESCSYHPRSDQEMVLLSFLPYIRDMSETEMMDFQMEVLRTIKIIKQQRLSNQEPVQHHFVNIPLPSPTMIRSGSHTESVQSSDY